MRTSTSPIALVGGGAVTDSLENDRLFTEDEAAAFLSVSVRTLQSWRCRRSDGPQFIRYSGRAIRYARADLVAWVAARRVSSTSDLSIAK
jgi:hypothetical protein